eukprot:3296118-Amphidinium_carterae.1
MPTLCSKHDKIIQVGTDMIPNSNSNRPFFQTPAKSREEQVGSNTTQGITLRESSPRLRLENATKALAREAEAALHLAKH